MRKSIIASIELESGEKEKSQKPLGDQNIIVIPQGDSYQFFYFDNKKAERLTLKKVRLIQVKAVEQLPKKKLLLEKK